MSALRPALSDGIGRGSQFLMGHGGKYNPRHEESGTAAASTQPLLWDATAGCVATIGR